MDPQTYYAVQSRFTDPGRQADLLDDLPRDVAGLCRVVQGLVVHYRMGHLFDLEIPEERLPEIDTRYAEPMFARIVELEDGSLAEERPPEKRLVGCCRDFTVLFVAMARHLGIPARARVGFADYFVSGFNVDHEVAEVWDAGERRWRLVDSEIDGPPIGARFDPTDVPRGRFIVGGLAWQMCRDGRADPETFLVDPELEIEDTRGWSYLLHNLIHDLAALNKTEMILWDEWGLIGKGPSEVDLALLDRVATLTLAAGETFPEVRSIYETTPGLKVTAAVKSYSPAVPEPQEVRLRG
jgi:Transglutaminase-like superfamily